MKAFPPQDIVFDVSTQYDAKLAQAIVNSGEAAPMIATVVELLRSTEDRVERRIIRAFDRGQVEPWPGDEPRVTLTPWLADRLEVRLEADSRRWMSTTGFRRYPRVQSSKGGTVCATDAHISLNKVISLEPEPVDAMIAYEQSGRREDLQGRFRGDPTCPLPTVLLGQRLQWPCSAWQTSDARPKLSADCPGCSGNLRPHEYCLVCDGYGRGWMLPRVQVARLRQLPRESRQADKPRAIRRAEKFARPG